MHLAQKGQYKGRVLLDIAGSLVWWLAEDREKDVACFISRTTTCLCNRQEDTGNKPFWSKSIQSSPRVNYRRKQKVSTSNESSTWYADTPRDRKQGHAIPGVLLACYQARDTRYQGRSGLPGPGGLSRNRPRRVRPPSYRPARHDSRPFHGHSDYWKIC